MAYARIGVVGILFHGDKTLVIQRSNTVAAPLKWCFPGGGIEAGETQEQALIREFQEEVGITICPIRFLLQTVTPWNVLLYLWEATATEEELARLHADPGEVKRTAWMTLEEVLNHPETLISNRPDIVQLLQERQND